MAKSEGQRRNIGRSGEYYVDSSGQLVPVPTEFYNTSHAPAGSSDGGQFDEGSDGPGRVRDPGTEDLGKKGLVTTKSKSKAVQKKVGELNEKVRLKRLSEEEFDAEIESATAAVEGLEKRREGFWTKLRKLLTSKEAERKWDERKAKQDARITALKAYKNSLKKDKADQKAVDELKDRIASEKKEQAEFEREVEKLASEQEKAIKDEAVYASGQENEV